MAAPLPDKTQPAHPHKPHVWAMETTGLLIVAVVLLVLTLIRYWSSIHQLFH